MFLGKIVNYTPLKFQFSSQTLDFAQWAYIVQTLWSVYV